jgi:glutamine amidotransferase
MTRHRLESGEPMGDALAGVVADTLAVTGGRLNLLLTDGHRVAATRCGDTLYTRADGEGVLVASEPSDDDGAWTAVPDGTVLVADHDSLDLQPLHPQPAPAGGQP